MRRGLVVDNLNDVRLLQVAHASYQRPRPPRRLFNEARSLGYIVFDIDGGTHETIGMREEFDQGSARRIDNGISESVSRRHRRFRLRHGGPGTRGPVARARGLRRAAVL